MGVGESLGFAVETDPGDVTLSGIGGGDHGDAVLVGVDTDVTSRPSGDTGAPSRHSRRWPSRGSMVTRRSPAQLGVPGTTSTQCSSVRRWISLVSPLCGSAWRTARVFWSRLTTPSVISSAERHRSRCEVLELVALPLEVDAVPIEIDHCEHDAGVGGARRRVPDRTGFDAGLGGVGEEPSVHGPIVDAGDEQARAVG